MFAHAVTVAGWHDVPTAWTFEPLMIAGIALIVAVDLVSRGAARSAPADLLALVALVVALLSPLDALAGALVAAHMVQHLLLVFVVAPALAAARPWHDWRRALGRAQRVRLTRLAQALPSPLRRGTPSALLATAAATVSVWLWHQPAAYGVAARSDRWHAVDHICLLVTATWFWSALHRQRVGRHHGTALAMLAVTSMSGTALGALLVFGHAGGYPPPAAGFGISAGADQEIAGLLMSMVPTLGLLLVMAHVLLDVLRPAAEPGLAGHAFGGSMTRAS